MDSSIVHFEVSCERDAPYDVIFWLYVWEVVTKDERTVLYVGRTGDSSSTNAQSPFTRLSQHLGTNKHANALRRHLQAHSIDPNSCESFEMIAYGPILPEAKTVENHQWSRDRIATMEKTLCCELAAGGYMVLNEVRCRMPLDPELWKRVRTAFSSRFTRLRNVQSESSVSPGAPA
jgi:hypothetical protein